MATVRSASNMLIPRDKPRDQLRVAVDAFLSQPGLSPQTRRSYRLTLTALTRALDAAGAEPATAAIEAAARLRWGTVGPATWNRHSATVRSFLGYAARHGLLPELRVELDRRREPADRTRALPKAALERLWNRRDVALRDKTLWRLLYETAARAGEALSLDVDDLDLANRRAAIRGKNGELDYCTGRPAPGICCRA
jgi:integrase